MLSFPVHTRHQGQGEGREAEAVLAPWPPSQRTQVKETTETSNNNLH